VTYTRRRLTRLAGAILGLSTVVAITAVATPHVYYDMHAHTASAAANNVTPNVFYDM